MAGGGDWCHVPSLRLRALRLQTLRPTLFYLVDKLLCARSSSFASSPRRNASSSFKPVHNSSFRPGQARPHPPSPACSWVCVCVCVLCMARKVHHGSGELPLVFLPLNSHVFQFVTLACVSLLRFGFCLYFSNNFVTFTCGRNLKFPLFSYHTYHVPARP